MTTIILILTLAIELGSYKPLYVEQNPMCDDQKDIILNDGLMCLPQDVIFRDGFDD